MHERLALVRWLQPPAFMSDPAAEPSRVGGHRSDFELCAESLRCSCCAEPFFFARHAGRTWRTQCPNATCAEVLLVTRDPTFRFKVETPSAHLRRIEPESPGLAQYAAEHWLEIGLAVAVAATVVPMLWHSATPGHDAILLVGVALTAALVSAVVFSWGAARWFDRRFRREARRRDTAEGLGRTPFVAVSATAGWSTPGSHNHALRP